MILLDFVGAVLTLAFWIVVIYVAVQIVRRGLRVVKTYEAGLDARERRTHAGPSRH